MKPVCLCPFLGTWNICLGKLESGPLSPVAMLVRDQELQNPPMVWHELLCGPWSSSSNHHVSFPLTLSLSLSPWTLSLSCLALQGQLQGEALSIPSNCSWDKKSVLHEVDSFWFLYSSHQNLPLYSPFLSGSWTHCTFFSCPWCILVLLFGEQRVGQCQSNILESWLSSIFFCDLQHFILWFITNIHT